MWHQAVRTYPAVAVPPPPPPPNVKPLAPPVGGDAAAPEPNLNPPPPPPPGATAKTALALAGLSKAEAAFLGADPGLGVSQQTQESLSASFGTMHSLKMLKC